MEPSRESGGFLFEIKGYGVGCHLSMIMRYDIQGAHIGFPTGLKVEYRP